jgi:flagellar motor switch/type III secretory pathway protein FliN
VFGTQQLSVEDAAGLQVGDTVLLSHTPTPGAGVQPGPSGLAGSAAWLVLGEYVLCHWQEAAPHGGPRQSGSVNDALAPFKLHRSTTMDSTMAFQPQANLTVPVEVTVDTPPQRLSEIQRWAPGSLITLASPVDGDQLHLRAGGRTLARGRLAAVGDMLAFEVIELYE